MCANASVALAQALVVLLTLVPRHTTWFSAFGAHTLYAFLLHETVLVRK